MSFNTKEDDMNLNAERLLLKENNAVKFFYVTFDEDGNTSTGMSADINEVEFMMLMNEVKEASMGFPE